MERKPAGRRSVALFQIGVPVSLAAAACVLVTGGPATAVPAASAGTAGTAPFVYVADKGRNEISQFATLSSGALRPLTPENVASGPFPYLIAVTPPGNNAYALDEGSDSSPVNEISQYTINPATGKLTPKSPRTVATAAGPIAMAFTPDGQNAYVADYNGNAISQFSISPATGKLIPKSPATVAAPGGPNSIKVAPDGKDAYITNVGASTIARYRINPSTGALSSKPVQTLPTGQNAQNVALAPDGKSAYVTGTGDNMIWQYSIDPATGKLTPKSPAAVASGPAPHDLAVAPDGRSLYVINVFDDTIQQFRISPSTGALSAKPASTATTVLHPEAIAIAPDGRTVYVTSENDGVVAQFAISPATGKLTPLAPATVTTPPSGSLGLAAGPAADLGARASAPARGRRGSSLTYTIKITDAGPSAAWQAALTDHLPAGTAFRGATATSGQCSSPRSGARGATVTCRLGTLSSGGTGRIQIKVTIKASSGTIRDQAAVTSVTPDPRTGNNTAAAATKITS